LPLCTRAGGGGALLHEILAHHVTCTALAARKTPPSHGGLRGGRVALVARERGGELRGDSLRVRTALCARRRRGGLLPAVRDRRWLRHEETRGMPQRERGERNGCGRVVAAEYPRHLTVAATVAGKSAKGKSSEKARKKLGKSSEKALGKKLVFQLFLDS